MSRAAAAWALLLLAAPAATADLAVTADGATRIYTTAALLARRDAASVAIPADVSYHRPMTYRAVRLRALLPTQAADTIEVRATDGFVAQLPAALVAGKATPWLAVEDPAHPWPRLPGGKASAGPFYIVWTHPEAERVSPEQWPYAVAALTAVDSPARRWPALAVPASATATAKHGQALFAANCLACHKLNGAGEGVVGPDLLRPMAATAYFTDAGLHALIRNPAAVRHWPDQKMPNFTPEVLSDSDIDAIIAYLNAFAGPVSKH